jgi:hypothetical protein
LSLDNVQGAIPPWEFILGQLCDEFSCLPSDLDPSLGTDGGEDPELLTTIMLYRSYARAKQRLDDAESEADIKITPMIERVLDTIQYLMERRKHVI